MELQLHNNYLYTTKLDLDLVEQKLTAQTMYKFIMENFANGEHHGGQASMLYNLYSKYNYFLYPTESIHLLYKNIQKVFHAANAHKHNGNQPDLQYAIQCWLNVYNKDEFIDWHGHWPSNYNSWHGFYCVDVEPNSSTTYKLSDGNLIDIKSENNLLVIGPSDDDKHKSSKWEQDYPRITIAFDIVPVNALYDNGYTFGMINHWVPI